MKKSNTSFTSLLHLMQLKEQKSCQHLQSLKKEASDIAQQISDSAQDSAGLMSMPEVWISQKLWRHEKQKQLNCLHQTIYQSMRQHLRFVKQIKGLEQLQHQDNSDE